MAYRGVKGSDPFVSKTSRNERFAQMSKQEQIIQQKKLEIEAKMLEQRAAAKHQPTNVDSNASVKKATTTTTTATTTTTSSSTASVAQQQQQQHVTKTPIKFVVFLLYYNL